MKTKFRSYDELKKDFESMNMKIQTDYEILTDLIKRLRKSEDEENRKTILTDLEFYLHQVRVFLSLSDHYIGVLRLISV